MVLYCLPGINAYFSADIGMPRNRNCAAILGRKFCSKILMILLKIVIFMFVNVK